MIELAAGERADGGVPAFRPLAAPQFSSRRWRHGRAAALLASRRHNPLIEGSAATANALLDAMHNVRFDMPGNGELLLCLLDRDDTVPYLFYPDEPALSSLYDVGQGRDQVKRHGAVSRADDYAGCWLGASGRPGS